MSLSLAERATRQILESDGLRVGTTLTLWLCRFKLLDRRQHQYRVGKYRLDFACPDILEHPGADEQQLPDHDERTAT